MTLHEEAHQHFHNLQIFIAKKFPTEQYVKSIRERFRFLLHKNNLGPTRTPCENSLEDAKICQAQLRLFIESFNEKK